jgi:hypothetical protein
MGVNAEEGTDTIWNWTSRASHLENGFRGKSKTNTILIDYLLSINEDSRAGMTNHKSGKASCIHTIFGIFTSVFAP